MNLTPTSYAPNAGTVDLDAARTRVNERLASFLADRARRDGDETLPPLAATVLNDFVGAGGKRIRPLLCVLGWHAATGAALVPDEVIDAACALELFHAFALIHDDVMDASDTRRGRPTVHRALTDRYREGRSDSLARRVGEGAAVLVGDLAQMWADELLHTADLTDDRLRAALRVWDTMRHDVMQGQILDVTAGGRPTNDVDRAMAIVRHKTAGYTIEHPLLLGATLADAPPDMLHALSDFAVPLGEAFQLRDDLLGVFGDPEKTGKSHLDDLREGKHTTLMALGLQRAAPHQAAVLHRLLGDAALSAADAEQIRGILTDSGARQQVEDMIEGRRVRVLHLLKTTRLLPPTAVLHLRALVDSATRRVS